MRIPRLYIPLDLENNTEVELDSASAHYLARVLRMQAGRELLVFNGKGGEFSAHIIKLEKKTAVIKLTRFYDIDRSSPLNIELAIGLSRGDKMDLIVQKATELGVSRITPLMTERCEVKLKGERQDKKLNHWRQIMISACEQCQLNQLPELSAISDLEALFKSEDQATLRLVLHHRANHSLSEIHQSLQPAPTSVLLLIGPEGGLSEEELGTTLSKGFTPLALGPRILRTETAPIVALAAVQQYWGDLNNL